MTFCNMASVSVVIPFYNSSVTFEDSFNSVLFQTLLPMEIIVVDDFSYSNELDFLKLIIEKARAKLAGKVKVKLILLDENRGASYARNVAVKNATSKYIAFLDSDDVWRDNKIDTQYHFMENNSFLMTGHGYIFDLTKERFKCEAFCYSEIKKFQFIYTNPFFTPTVMVRRDIFKPFDSSFRRVDDYKCWVENYTPGSVAIIHNKLAGGFKHPIGSGGLTGSLSKMHDSYIEVLKSLYGEKKISLRFFYLARLVECVKYPLRIIRNKFKFLF